MPEPNIDQVYSINLGDTLEALRTSGLLWAINSKLLHPEGYESRVTTEGLIVLGWGNTERQWPPGSEEAVDTARRAFKQTLLDAQQFNRPEYHQGHSPGFNSRRGRER